jgi:hypothetical protein
VGPFIHAVLPINDFTENVLPFVCADGYEIRHISFHRFSMGCSSTAIAVIILATLNEIMTAGAVEVMSYRKSVGQD